MSSRSAGMVKWSIVVVSIACFASFFFNKIDLSTLSVNDLGRHITNGRMILRDPAVWFTNYYSYTEPAFTFVNHHWLSGVVFYLVWNTWGFAGLGILKIVLGIGIFAVLFAASLRKAPVWVVAAASLPVMLILKERTELRPELFSYILFAVFLYLLIYFDQHPTSKRIYWLIPLQLLWVNLHSFFFWGILLTAGLLIEKCFQMRDKLHRSVIRTLSMLLAALIGVCFVNPNGWRGALYPLSIFKNYAFAVYENRALWMVDRPWTDLSIAAFLFMIPVVSASFFFSLKQKPLFFLWISISTVLSGVFLVRSLPLFGLIALPVLSSNLNPWYRRIKRFIEVRLPRRQTAVRYGFALLFIAGMIAATAVVAQIEAARGPVGDRGVGLAADANRSAEFFRDQGLRGPVFNDYDIGSYLIYHLYPNERVFVDNRPEAYPAGFFTGVYVPMIREEAVWQKKSAEYGFSVIFFSQRDTLPGLGEFLMRRMHDPSWALVYADAYAVILVKNEPKYARVIEKYRITGDTVGAVIAPLVGSGKLADRMGAANLCILLGRTDIAVSLYTDIAAGWPHYERGRIILKQLQDIEKRR